MQMLNNIQTSELLLTELNQVEGDVQMTMVTVGSKTPIVSDILKLPTPQVPQNVSTWISSNGSSTPQITIRKG